MELKDYFYHLIDNNRINFMCYNYSFENDYSNLK